MMISTGLEPVTLACLSMNNSPGYTVYKHYALTN